MTLKTALRKGRATMRNFKAENERIKREYFKYLRDAKRREINSNSNPGNFGLQIRNRQSIDPIPFGLGFIPLTQV